MMNLICKENEGKSITVLTDDFNDWLKENEIGWEVVKDYSGCAMCIENGTDTHEPFSFVMYKKFDIYLKKFDYAEIDGERFPSKIELEFEYYKHNDIYFELLNDETIDNNKYAKNVREEYMNRNIDSVEASYLLLSKEIEPAYWL